LEHPDEVSIQKKRKLHKTLRKDFKDIPKKSKIDLDEWAVVNVSPSVVANPYLPALRVFSYNVTSHNAGTEKPGDPTDMGDQQKKTEGSKRKHSHRHGGKPKDCKKKKNRDRWECRSPQGKWHSDEHAPSRTNTLWSPLGYSQVICIFSLRGPPGDKGEQFYMPALGTANETHPPEWELEYVTYELSALQPPEDATEAEVAKFVYPIPPTLLPRELKKTARETRFAPYGMKDLTIRSWVKLARKLGKKKKLWKRFKEYMYLGG
jgi:endopolyphosphatase